MKLNASVAVESIIVSGLDTELFPTTIIKGKVVIPTSNAGTLKSSFIISFETNRGELDMLREIWHKRAIQELGVEDEDT